MFTDDAWLMRIKESKNLKYEKKPLIGPMEGYERIDPDKCFLERFDAVDDKLVLYFKNNSQAVIKGINIEGGREIDLIEAKLNEFVGRTYEEILEANF